MIRPSAYIFPDSLQDSPCSGWRCTDMPYAGLGLPLTTCDGTMEQRAAAIRSLTVPPSMDLGITFADLPDGGSLNILECLKDNWLRGDELPGMPGPDHPAFARLPDISLVPLLPIVDLPGTGDYWAAAEHFAQLHARLSLGGFDADALPRDWEWTHPPTGPLPYVRQVASGRVTPRHVDAFCADFPGLAEVLKAAIPWGPRGTAAAGSANAAAGRVLGIEADLRVGRLVSSGAVGWAIELAAGDVLLRAGGSLVGKITNFVEGCLPTVVAPRVGCEVANLVGAAWSCAADALLSRREACLVD